MLSTDVTTGAPTILHVERNTDRALTVRTLCQQLQVLAWLISVTEVMALKDAPRPLNSHPPKPWIDPVRYIETKGGSDAQVRGLQYGSVEIVLDIASIVTGSVIALRGLIYVLKRLYGIDLEFRSHREEQRRRFYEAKAVADDAAHWDEPLLPETVERAVANKSQLTAGFSGEAALLDEDGDA